MLLEYSFKNFASFKDVATFTLRTKTDDVKAQFPLNYVQKGKNEVLKTAVVVGENAGGKTNFVKSLSYLKSLLKESSVKTQYKFINDSYWKGEKTQIANTTQDFVIVALINDVEYTYKLKIDCLGVKYEEFFTRSSNQEEIRKIFVLNRSEENINLTDPIKMNFLKHRANEAPLITLKYDLQKDSSFIEDKIGEILEQLTTGEENSGAYIRKYALLGVKSAVVFTNWLDNTLFVNISSDGENYFQRKKLTYEDAMIVNDKKEFLEILRMSDPSIKEITVDLDAPFTNSVITRKAENGNISKHTLAEDSAGIRDFFPLAIQIYKVVKENKVVVIDEMDRSLNPVLSDKIVALINSMDHEGQFIFTTHNVFHLDLNIYMKEQIYFVTKDLKSLESEMYSLEDFPEVTYEEEEPIYNFYLKGMLGGITVG